MNSFSILSRVPNWDYLRNVDRPAISLPEFQSLPSSSPFEPPAALAEAAVESYPFLCPASTDGSTASTIVAGTVNGVTVTNLSLTISDSGTKYVYFNVTYTQSVSANNYVVGFSGAITCALATGSSIPSDTSTHLYRLIATYASGIKTVQAIRSSMEVAVRGYNASAAFSTIWGRS